METLQWPPQLPDLNLIEALWGDIECKLKKTFQRDKNTAEVQKHCLGAWAAVRGEQLHRLIESMPTRLQAVIAANGGATPF